MQEVADNVGLVVTTVICTIIGIGILIAIIGFVRQALELRKTAKRILKSLPTKNDGCWLSGIEFHECFSDLFMWPDDYIIDTGNWENVNMAMMERFAEKVQKHPFLFSLFFHY